MVTVKEREGNGTIRVSLSLEALQLLNAKFTKRKRGKAIENLILKEYGQTSIEVK